MLRQTVLVPHEDIVSTHQYMAGHDRVWITLGYIHSRTHESQTCVWRQWLFDMIKCRYSFNVHDWLLYEWVCEQPGCFIKHRKEDGHFVMLWMFSLWILPHFNNVNNHSLMTLVRRLWVWRWHISDGHDIVILNTLIYDIDGYRV